MEKGGWFLEFTYWTEFGGFNNKRGWREIILNATTEDEARAESRKIVDSDKTLPRQYLVTYRILQESSELEALFAAVFLAQDEGRLEWRSIGAKEIGAKNSSQVRFGLVSEVPLKNGHIEDTTVKVIFFLRKDGHFFLVLDEALSFEKPLPFLGFCDSRVRRLFGQVNEKMSRKQRSLLFVQMLEVVKEREKIPNPDMDIPPESGISGYE